MLLAVSFLDEGLCIEPRRGSPSTPLFGRVDPHKVSGCRHALWFENTLYVGGYCCRIFGTYLCLLHRCPRHTQGLWWSPPPDMYPKV